jgi:hypothetical protein
MQVQSSSLGIVRLTMPSRSRCEWIMERIIDAHWLPELETLRKEVEALDSYSDEKPVQITGSTALQGLVIRGACPTNASRCAYVILWPQLHVAGGSSTAQPETIAAYDLIGRILLLLMRGGSSGVAAAQSLVQTNAAIKAADDLSRNITPELRAAAFEFASKAEGNFDSLILKACVQAERE